MREIYGVELANQQHYEGFTMSEPLNYCRQLKQDLIKIQNDFVVGSGALLEINAIIDRIDSSVKFQIEAVSDLFIDKDFKGLDWNLELHLPYKKIVLEYPFKFENKIHKNIVFAYEAEDLIHIHNYSNLGTGWDLGGGGCIPKNNYLRIGSNGHIVLALSSSCNDIRIIKLDAELLLNFLNILQCSNVKIERTEPKKLGKKIKSALPFDTYHTIMIDTNSKPSSGANVGQSGDRRSPREHIRRGHIRKLENGKKIWINSQLVNGNSLNKVEKSYRVKS